LKDLIKVGWICAIVVLSLSRASADDWTIEVVDAEGYVGAYTSIILDAEGFPHISYYDGTNEDLRYAYWDGFSWHFESPDTGGIVGRYTSIALDADHFAHISYFDQTNGDLKYAYRNSSGWHLQTVDTTGDVGRNSSIVLDSNGFPYISYCDWTNMDLKYAYKDISGWHIEYLDTTGWVGYHTSIVLDSTDFPHISYYDYTNGDLKYAYEDNSGWHLESVDTVEDVGYFTSIALATGDYPHISYCDWTNGDLKYAYQDGYGWHIETPDTVGNVGRYTSIALDSGGFPHISHCDYGNGDLKYVYKDSSGWHIQTPDTVGKVGRYTSLALDVDDHPHISYYDWTNGDLKHAWYGPFPGIILERFVAQVEGETITLHWSVQATESEQIIGFNLYRRELIAGMSSLGEDVYLRHPVDSWLAVNFHLITGENPYAFTDFTVEQGVAYEYQLEVVLDIGTENLGLTQATVRFPSSFAILATYPNPATDTLTCLLTVPSDGVVNLALYDLSGRVVLKKRVEVSEPTELSAELDVSGLASGVYTLRASSDCGEVSPACGGVAVVVR